MGIEDRLRQMPMGQAVIGGLFVAGIYYAVAYNGGEEYLAQTVSNQQRITTAQTELENLDKVINEAQNYRDMSNRMGRDIDIVVKYIPQDFTTADLMKILSNEAKTAGVNLLRMNDQGGRSYDTSTIYEKLSVDMELEGSYSQLLLFLSYLTRLDKIVTIDNMRMEKATNSLTKENTLHFTGAFNAYRYRPSTGEPK